jgi:hypothetical protein
VLCVRKDTCPDAPKAKKSRLQRLTEGMATRVPALLILQETTCSAVGWLHEGSS